MLNPKVRPPIPHITPKRSKEVFDGVDEPMTWSVRKATTHSAMIS
jgi:hypothetical protein